MTGANSQAVIIHHIITGMCGSIFIA